MYFFPLISMEQLTLFSVDDSATEAAKNLIRHYVKRGDTVESLKASHLGHCSPGGMAAQIGGWCDPFERCTKNKMYSTEHIIVNRDMNGVEMCRIFKLREIYALIQSE